MYTPRDLALKINQMSNNGFLGRDYICFCDTSEKKPFVLKKEWVDKTILLEFKNEKFNVPIGFHEVLSTLYGDYMIPPPISQQITHHDNKIYKETK